VLLSDVLEFKRRRDERREAVLRTLAEEAESTEFEY